MRTCRVISTTPEHPAMATLQHSFFLALTSHPVRRPWGPRGAPRISTSFQPQEPSHAQSCGADQARRP
eukprot:6635639-Alexandrium_andersonii.AAC.1